VDAPPVVSLEADRLLAATYERFGINGRFEALYRGRNLAFRGQHWLVIKVKVIVGHMRLL
jgi:hypothetical protein